MKNFNLFLIIFLYTASFNLFPQFQDVTRVHAPHSSVKESFPLVIGGNEILVLYVNSTGDSLFSIRTLDAGGTWHNSVFVREVQSYQNELIHLTGIRTVTGRLIVSWSVYNSAIQLMHSDDNGASWSQPINLSQPPEYFNITNLNLAQLDNKIVLSSNLRFNQRLLILQSTDNGVSWSSNVPLKTSSGTFISNASDLSYSYFSSFYVRGIYLVKAGDWSKIYTFTTGINDLATADTSLVIQFDTKIHRPKLCKTADDMLWIVYHSEMRVNNFPQTDIFYLKSSDRGITWSQPERFTGYFGDDMNHNVTAFNNYPLVSFATERYNDDELNTAVAKIGFSVDDKYPPKVASVSINDGNYQYKKFNLRAVILYDKPLNDIDLFFHDTIFMGKLFDDGLHNDSLAGDNIYGNDFQLPSSMPSLLSYVAETKHLKISFNRTGNLYPETNSLIIPATLSTTYNSNIYSHKSNVNYKLYLGGSYDNFPLIFEAGFILGGLDQGSPWAKTNIKTTPTLIDFRPGPVGTDPDDPRNRIYVVRKEDKPFGASWQNWRYAVELGADFYDGDGDGIYNPVDKNFNGTWDPNEDMPLLIGDETFWFVFNDSVPDSLTNWKVEPKKIEAAQTVFTSSKPEFENIIFLRFKLTNRSSNILDSVYFGLWADTDIGDYSSDYLGCDTILNSGFVYKKEEDTWYYGINPPASFTTLLQGPVVPSGSSDTAYIKLGSQFDEIKIPSAKNLNMTSFHPGLKVDLELRHPDKVSTVRNYLKGLKRSGQFIDPCTHLSGQVFGGVNCSEVNPIYAFSGDPVSNTGWIHVMGWDIRSMVNSGPFILKPGESHEIIAAYVAARGSDAINSVTVTRDNVKRAIEEYNNNFASLAYNPPPPTNPVVSYSLYQNYPNPFNPATTIRFELPEDGIVNIEIYDILGRRVKTLLNEFRGANRYEINFNAEGLSSGVYIYRLKINNFIDSKKMLYLK
jgi:hypothetical protein